MFKRFVHFANTAVESELCSFSPSSPLTPFKVHPHAMQLQFLPLLYGSVGDSVAVSDFPEFDYLDALQNHPWFKNAVPHLTLLKSPQLPNDAICQPWGHSPSVQAWATKNAIDYSCPTDWFMIKKIHSKEWSFKFSQLPLKHLVKNLPDLAEWIKQVSGPKVIKSCYGLSGQGNFLFNADNFSPELMKFCTNEWNENRPLIAEPWLERVEDFSTQWMINKEGTIDYLGSTRFEIQGKGTYIGTLAGKENLLFPNYLAFLEEHKVQAISVMHALKKEGYFGPAGIDAFIYRQGNDLKLHAIVEVNPRQTMSSVALQIQKRLAPKKQLRLSFSLQPSYPSFLPMQIIDEKGKKNAFRRHLNLEII